MDAARLTADLRVAAAELGFGLVGACPAVTPPGWPRFLDWLDAGYAGEMSYLAARSNAYEHPRGVMPGVRSLLMLATIYRGEEPRSAGPGQGRVSRYAWGTDYHDTLHDRLRLLAAKLQALAPGAKTRGVVDTAPLLEREFAQLAGLGWVGKNTLLINPKLGSWFFLSALLTDVELAYDEPFALDHCGSCRACLDVCPTGAFAAPYVLDATKCVSYLTIELKAPVPRELRGGMGDWLFGCDACQDACPWNHKAPANDDEAFAARPEHDPCELVALFDLDEAAFRRRFRGTPLWRPKRRGLLRNAALVLGNQRHEPAVPVLVRALQDEEPLVRGASAWALGKIGGQVALDALAARLPLEPTEEVREEIEEALRHNR
jgi:epoxyqueuosine reductase